MCVVSGESLLMSIRCRSHCSHGLRSLSVRWILWWHTKTTSLGDLLGILQANRERVTVCSTVGCRSSSRRKCCRSACYVAILSMV